MNLPRDPNDWTDAHLAAAIIERDNAFARYEEKYNRDHPRVSDALYRDYQRKAERVEDIRRVVKG